MNPGIAITIKPKAINFMYELERELNAHNKNEDTLELFKAILHAIRDKLCNKDAMLLLSGLPPYLKPIFWEGWKPSQGSVIKENFIELVTKYSRAQGKGFMNEKEIEANVKKVFSSIENKLSPEKRQAIKACIPSEIKIYL